MSIAENLKRLREAKKFSQGSLASASGVSQQLISQLERGINQSTKNLPKLAEALGVSVSEIDPSFGSVESANDILTRVKLSAVRVVGTVEAGTFREVDEFDQSDFEELSLPIDSRFPHARQMAFNVSGDSMNDLRPRPILSGDRAVCVAYSDVAHEVPLRDGMVVVVERSRDGGHTREWSIKQIELYEDRTIFAPRSTNSNYKPIVIERDHDTDNGMSVEVIAIVRRVVNDIEF
ncbi:helix-turn-helix domain-containing protein [Paenochrobactrum pullorum]|uniref:helix-turn-helix domain-containing protein n=1 Tax=Paenochrobactrum pullorum TaxID=1324351 RepID=UPI0035BC0D0F